MKKLIIFGVVASLSISMAGCSSILNNKVSVNNGEKQIGQQVEINIDELNKEAVIEVVKGFGSKLKNVSLLDASHVEESMNENYSEFVAGELIDEWLYDLGNAPGRLVTSPWPDEIQVESAEKTTDEKYLVKGKIIEKTNTEDKASTQAINLIVEKIDDKWIISDASLGEYK